MARPTKAEQQAARASRETAKETDRTTPTPSEPKTPPSDSSTSSSEQSASVSANQVHARGDDAPDSSASVPFGLDGSPVFEPLLTIEEVSLWLRKPKGTLYAWRSRGIGPRAYKVGNDIRYAPSEVLRWLGSVA